MESIDYEINDEITARVYHSEQEKMIYLVDDSTGSELAKVDLIGVDFGHFLSIISSGDGC